MNLPPKENLMTTKEAGELFGYTSDYISRLIRSGKITGKRIGHNWLIEKESLVQFLNTQGNHKIVRARTLASERAEEYRAHRSLLHRTTKALTTPLPISQFGIGHIGHSMSKINTGKSSFRSHAFALLVALLVVVSGAFAAHASTIPQFAASAVEIARTVASGFGETFGDIPAHIIARIDAAKNEVAKISPRVATSNEIAATHIASPILVEPDLSALRMALDENQNVRIASQLSGETPKLPAINGSVVTADDVQSFVLNTYALATSPSRAASAVVDAYVALGENAYTGIGAAFAEYNSLIRSTAEKVLALAATTRDALKAAPEIIANTNLAFGTAVIDATHALMDADVAASYGLAAAAPASARVTVALLGTTGNALAFAASHVPALATAAYLRTTEMPARIAPAIAQAVWGVEYSGAIHFVAAANTISGGYLASLNGAGALAYESAKGTREVASNAGPFIANARIALGDAYLGALGKTALAFETFARTPMVTSITHSPPVAAAIAAVLPALTTGEKIALGTYEVIQSLINRAGSALAFLFTPSSPIVYPNYVPQHITTNSTTTRTTNSYTTIVQGVSPDLLNQSLATLRLDVFRAIAANTSSTIIQRFSDARSNGVFNGGTFDGGSMTNGISVTAIDGIFTNLFAGTTWLATTTVTGDLTVSGIITPAIISAGTSIAAPYFIATDASATSTFAGSLNVDNGGFVYATSTRNIGIGILSPAALLAIKNSTSTQPIFIAQNDLGTEVFRITNAGFIGIGTTSPGYALAVEGSSSLGNQAIAGYFTATSSTATSTFAGHFAVGTSSPWGDGFFTVGTSSPLLYISSNTGRIGIGTSSPAYTLDVNGTIRSASDVYFNTNTTLGSATTTDITYFNSRIADHLVPTVDNVSDLGDGANWLRWRTGYFGTSVGIAGTATSTGVNLLASGAYLIDSASTLSINTTHNQPVLFGTGNVLLPYASSTALTLANALWVGGNATTTSNGNFTTNGNLAVRGTTNDIAGTLNLSGGTLTSTAALSIASGAASDLLLTAGSSNINIASGNSILATGANSNIGSAGIKFNTLYVNTVNATTLVGTVSGGATNSADWTINAANAGADTQTMNLIFDRGSVTPNALLTWNANGNAKRFEFNQPLYIQNASASTTITTLDLKAVAGQTADIFRIASSSGASLLNFSAAGNLGLGVSAPAYALDVFGSGHFTQLVDASYFVATTTTATSTFAGGLTVGTSQLVVQHSTGNIGIGTSSPFALLSVAGNGFFNGNLTAANMTATGTLSVTGVSTFLNASSTNLSASSNLWVGGNATTSANGNFTTNGSIGIGVLSPAYKLDVNGLGHFSGLVDAANLVATSSSIASIFNGGFLANASSTITSGLFTMSGGASTTAFTTSGQANLASLAGAVVSSLTANYLPKWNSGTFANSLVYDTGTNVGIGTSTPAWNLQVAGVRPSFALSDTSAGTNLKHWLLSSMGGNLYIGTSTDAYGTSTPAALTITNAGNAIFAGTITATSFSFSSPLAVGYGGTGAITLTGLLQGNGTSAVTGITGTAGQFPYYNGASTLLATSTIFLATSANIGIGTTTPGSKLSVTTGLSVGADYGVAAPSNGAIIEGNVGIGTTSPVSKLSVVGESAFAGGASVGLGYAGTTAPSNGLIIQGNVGIGTTNPSSALNVAGTLTLDLSNNPELITNGSFTSDTSSWLTGFSGVLADVGSGQSGNALQVTNGAANTGLAYQSFTTVAGQTYRVNLYHENGTGTGSLAIGTNAGGANIIGLSAVNDVAWTLHSVNFVAVGATTYIALYNDGTNGHTTLWDEVSVKLVSGGTMLANGTGNNYFAGNVGIGTTTPSALLNIAGAAVASAPGTAFLNFTNTHGTSQDQFGINFINQGYAGSARINSLLDSGGATSELQFLTGGATPTVAMTILGTNGNLGIGTTTPAGFAVGGSSNKILDINGGTSGGLLSLHGFTNTDPLGELSFYHGSNGNYIDATGMSTAANNALIFRTTNTNSSNVVTEAMRITSTGNVGIGTTSPGTKLTIQSGNSTFEPTIDIINSNTTVGARTQLVEAVTAQPRTGANVIANIEAEYTGTGATGPMGALTFYTNAGSSGVGISEKMRITNTGNVGIGTTTPQNNLHVYSITSGGGVSVDGNTNPAIQLLNSGTVKSVIGLPTVAGAWSTDAAANDLVIRTNATSQKILFNVNGGSGASMMALNNGNVGIGTTVPQYKLDVGSGGIIGGYSDATHYGYYQPYNSGSGFSIFNHYWPSGGGYKFQEFGADLVTILSSGNVGVGTPTPQHTLDVAGDIGAISFVNTSTRALKTDIEYATASSTDDMLSQLVKLEIATYRYKIENQSNPLRIGLIAEDTSAIAPEILSPNGKGVDIYKFATFTAGAVQALAARVDSQNMRLTSLESRVKALETGSISSATGSPITIASTSLASAFNAFGAFISKGIAQFGSLVADRFVAATNSAGTSSAGTVTLITGNTVAQVTNAYVLPTSKIFVTFNSQITGSWWVSDKAVGSFRVVLSAPQTTDVSFDYFLVQTEGQIATSTPATLERGSTSLTGGSTVAPAITLLGDNPLHLSVGGTYSEPGITIRDSAGGAISTYITFVNGVQQSDLASAISTGNNVTYIITYKATDAAGNTGSATRSVIVGTIGSASGATGGSSSSSSDTTAPVVTLTGAAAMNLTVGDTFTDPGATAADNIDGDLTSKITVTGTVNTAVAGSYTIIYKVTEAAGNVGTASRLVSVVAGSTTSTPVPEPAPTPTTTPESTPVPAPAPAPAPSDTTTTTSTTSSSTPSI